MAFAQLEDLTGKIELVIFPSILADFAELWQPERLILVEGRQSNRDSQPKIIAEKVSPLQSVEVPALNEKENQTYLIELPGDSPKTLIGRLKLILEEHPGPIPVELRLLQGAEAKLFQTKLRVKPSPKLSAQLKGLLEEWR